MNWQIYFIEFSYLLASILFILGLKGLSHVTVEVERCPSH